MFESISVLRNLLSSSIQRRQLLTHEHPQWHWKAVRDRLFGFDEEDQHCAAGFFLRISTEDKHQWDHKDILSCTLAPICHQKISTLYHATRTENKDKHIKNFYESNLILTTSFMDKQEEGHKRKCTKNIGVDFICFNWQNVPCISWLSTQGGSFRYFHIPATSVCHSFHHHHHQHPHPSSMILPHPHHHLRLHHHQHHHHHYHHQHCLMPYPPPWLPHNSFLSVPLWTLQLVPQVSRLLSSWNPCSNNLNLMAFIVLLSWEGTQRNQQ